MTSDPESADVTKNTATKITARVEVKADQGRYSKKLNKASEASMAASADNCPPASPISRKIAVLPNTVIHRNVNTVGTMSTPNTNSLTVRPREMRAINMPTNGDQEIHQAQ